jgi:integrase
VRFYLRKYERSPYWYFKITSRGKGVVQNWTSTGKRKKRDAEQHAAREVAALETQDHPTSVDEMFEILAAHKERKRSSDATMEKLSLKASHIRTYFGASRDVRTISLAETTAYMDKRRADGVHDSTIELELRELRAGLRRLKMLGKYDGEPAAIWPPELKRKFPGRKRWLPIDEYQKLLAALAGPTGYYRSQRHGAGRHGGSEQRRQWVQHKVREGRDWSEHLAMYAYTGMRWSELYKLTAADVAGDQLHVPGTKTDGSDRWIPLHPDALRIVAVRARQRPQGPLFPCRSPNMDDEKRAWLRALSAACRRADIEHASSNDLRRTFCSWCFQAGVGMELVIKWMGHASAQMIREVYAQPSAEQGRREMAKLPVTPQSPHGARIGETADDE